MNHPLELDHALLPIIIACHRCNSQVLIKNENSIDNIRMITRKINGGTT
jgi:DNA-directed RNA polymerase subunit RPC12/RpoP